MTQFEFDSKKAQLAANHENIMSKAKKEVEDFINGTIGDEFKLACFSHRGFSVQLFSECKPVFGTDFQVYVDRDFFNDNVGKVEANIGTCGSFEVGIEDAQEKTYCAFAQFLKGISRYGLKDKLIRLYDEITANQEAYDELKKEFESK